MKFLHLSDLHFGKSLYGVSLIDNKDQAYWAERFLEKVEEVQPDAIVIAGDIYDRSAPSGEAVELMDSLLTRLEQLQIPVMMISGNHDSGQKLAFAGDILAKQNVYIAGKPDKELCHVTVQEKDRSGEVTFWLMPYLFPAIVAQKLEDDSIGDYETAVRRLLEEQEIDFSKRNVLVAHQNITADGREAERGGSESMVGGVGQIDYRVFDGFDYVALGHIHSSYHVGRKGVRYAGSPLCYHFNETRQPQKGPLLVELGEKNTEVRVQPQIIEPLHP
ncbi:MAG: exonuclease SbcCD subunit D, partial [Lachnospiraceae bacterium]|nr:exonuclease SbcCD subunit D [Lachnospiraceae bacterium]